MVVGNKALLLFIGATDLGAISIFISNTSTASDQEDEDGGNQFGINEQLSRNTDTGSQRSDNALCVLFRSTFPHPPFAERVRQAS